ncbi:hypothetical protein LTR95_002550 [Oleoguttula sp. CCFEE 5521]
MSAKHRSEDLDMDCLCDLCASPPALRDVSDTRRFMLRALYEFIHREDPAGEMPSLLKRMWMHQSAIDDLARLRPEESPKWTTVHFFVIAKLLEVEGIITDTTITSYARAAVNIVHIADNAGLKVLPPREFENVKMWTQKSEKMARKTGYTDYEGEERMRRFWYAMGEVLLAVGPEGEIPELEKVASHAGGMRGLKRRMGIKGTLRPIDHLKKAGNGDLFEIKSAAAKALTVFARQAILTGACVLIGSLIIVTDQPYCGRTPQDTMLAHPRLSIYDKEMFDGLRDAPVSSPAVRRFMEDHKHELPSIVLLMRIFSQSRFNEHTVTTTVTERHSGAAYDLVSMLNHCCRPQMTVYCDDYGTRRVYAHRNIAAGEKIGNNYHEKYLFLSLEDRKNRARDQRYACFMIRSLRDDLEDSSKGRSTEYPSTVEGLRIRADVLMGLSALPDREYNAWYTVHRLMLTILLDAEGLHIPLTIVSYASAAANLVCMADDLGLKVLPSCQYGNVNLWTQKSEAMAQKTGHLVVYGHETQVHKQWMKLREVLLAVVEGGGIPPLKRTAGVVGF